MLKSFLSFVRVAASSISQKTGVALLDLVGFGVGGPGEEDGDVRDAQEMFNGFGLWGRPLDDERKPGRYAEAMAALTSDGRVPFAYRDQRLIDALRKGAGAEFPNKGQLGVGGYGGAFLGFKYEVDEDRDQVTIYIPYARGSDGVPTKAHTVTFGKDGSGKPLVSVISGEGPRIILLDDKGQLVNKAGDAWVEVSPDGVGVVGNFKVYGACDLNGVTIDPTGNVEAPGEVTAKAATAPVNLSTHLHPTAMGPSGAPTPGT